MPKRTKKKIEKINVSPKVAVNTDTPVYYANYIQVSHTQYDFSLSIARIGSPLTDEQLAKIKNGEPLLIDALLQVTIPPAVAEGLVRAVTQQLKKYSEIKLNQEGSIAQGEGKHKQPDRVQ